MLLATFNVNGVRARLALLLDWLGQNPVDALCLQETKCQDKDFPVSAFQEAGYHCSFIGQKSYNGVAILSRVAPDEVHTGLYGQEDEQARLVAARLGELWVVNTYVPQGREVGSEAFAHKLDFLARLRAWLDGRFTPADPLVWAGDINIAPADDDLYDPERLAGGVGCHPDERAALKEVKGFGLTDLFRRLHPEGRAFTFWDYRLPQSFKRGLGWRLDHIYATEGPAGACRKAWVDTGPRGLVKPSDHTPVLVELNIQP